MEPDLTGEQIKAYLERLRHKTLTEKECSGKSGILLVENVRLQLPVLYFYTSYDQMPMTQNYQSRAKQPKMQLWKKPSLANTICEGEAGPFIHIQYSLYMVLSKS